MARHSLQAQAYGVNLELRVEPPGCCDRGRRPHVAGPLESGRERDSLHTARRHRRDRGLTREAGRARRRPWSRDGRPRARVRALLPLGSLRRRPPVGTGLGLAIVAELAAAMGGRVTVESTTGAGAAFTLELEPLRFRILRLTYGLRSAERRRTRASYRQGCNHTPTGRNSDMKRSSIVVAVAAVLATLVATTAAFAGRRERQDALPLRRSAQGHERLVRDRDRAERQPPGAPLAARPEPGADVRDRREDGLPEVDERDPGAGRHRRPRRQRLRDGERPRRSRRLARGDQGNARRHRRRPRPDPEHAGQAAVPLPRHVRLDGRRQGDDRREGRQPPRAAAHDRAGRPADVLDRERDGVPPLGAPHPDRDRCLQAEGRRPDRDPRPGRPRRRRSREVEATAARRVADREPKAQEANQSAQS